MWLKDILGEDNMDSYAVICRDTSCPVAVSERLATKFRFREVLEKKQPTSSSLILPGAAASLSQKRLLTWLMHTTYPLQPIITEDPSFGYSIHLGTAARNCYITESSWEMYTTVFPYFIKNTPVPENGFVSPPEGAELGIEFSEDTV